jgi:pre-mRNA-processing factor 39
LGLGITSTHTFCSCNAFSCSLFTSHSSPLFLSPVILFIADLSRSLFETAADAVGIDYHSETFWDEYIKFEVTENQPEKAFAVLERAIHVPMEHYQRFFDKFRRDAFNRPLDQVLIGDLLEVWKGEAEQEFVEAGYTPQDMEIDRRIRAKAELFHNEIFNRTQNEVYKRYQFEGKITKPYYVPYDVEPEEIVAWTKYLDFEEAEGDYQRIVFLYERALTPLANYDEFWMRYARWMRAQGTNGVDVTKDLKIDENVRNIYRRASIFCPIGRPHTRILWANWEEAKERVPVARDIHQAVLWKLDNKPAIVTHLAKLELRHYGIDNAVKVYEENLPSNSLDVSSKGWLVADWADMLYQHEGDADAARDVFLKNADLYLSVPKFWVDWLQFELKQVAFVPKKRTEQQEHIKFVMDGIQKRARLPLDVIRDCALLYMNYLEMHGGPDAMKNWITMDGEVNGSVYT